MNASDSMGSGQTERLTLDETPLSPDVEDAIQTDLAPSMAVAMLAKTDHPGDSAAPAMKCIGAGVSGSELADFVRIQFMFENGTVLPIDVPRAGAEALANGLLKDLRS